MTASVVKDQTGPAFRGVLFDLDGTLVDSAPDIITAVNRMLVEVGHEAVAAETVYNWIGNGTSRLVKRALTGQMNGEPPEEEFEPAHDLFVRFYAQKVCHDSRVYDGVVWLLEKLTEMHVSLGVVTNKRAELTEPLLAQVGISKFFHVVVSGDTLATMKPDPEPLLHAASVFNLTPAECLMVGDSCNDLTAARAAGMASIAVSYGYNGGQDLHQYDPLAVIHDITAVISHAAFHSWRIDPS